MTKDFELILLSSLVFNNEYRAKVMVHLKKDYFEGHAGQTVFSFISDFITKYHAAPTIEALQHCATKEKVSQGTFDSINKLIGGIESYAESQVRNDVKWLVDETEEWCKRMAFGNALKKAYEVYDGADGDIPIEAIPDLMQEAVNINFDCSVGHDYFLDVGARYDALTEKLDRIPCDLSCINYITRGGFAKKKLYSVLAGTGVGKTYLMTEFAASFLRRGKNVLYVSLEIGENEFGARVDANLAGIKTEDIPNIPKEAFVTAVEKAHAKCGMGRMYIKQFPSTMCTTRTIEALLSELWQKQSFKPDVVFVDYLGILGSYRLKSSDGGTNAYLKSVSEELRSFAIQHNVICITAGQLNRDGNDNSNPTIKNVAESIGTMFTMDLSFIMLRTEELDQCGQVKCVQIKNRDMDIAKLPSFTLTADRDYQRLGDSADLPPGIKSAPTVKTAASTKETPVYGVPMKTKTKVQWKM